MHDGTLDESLFDEVFDHEPECNCECGCTVPVQGQCVDCSENSDNVLIAQKIVVTKTITAYRSSTTSTNQLLNGVNNG